MNKAVLQYDVFFWALLYVIQIFFDRLKKIARCISLKNPHFSLRAWLPSKPTFHAHMHAHERVHSLDMSVWMHICPSFHPQSYWWQLQAQYTGNGRTCCWSELQIRCLLLASKPLQALPCLYSCGNEEPSRRQVEQGPGWGQGEGTRVRQQAGKLTRGSGYMGDRSGGFGRVMKM